MRVARPCSLTEELECRIQQRDAGAEASFGTNRAARMIERERLARRVTRGPLDRSGVVLPFGLGERRFAPCAHLRAAFGCAATVFGLP